MCWYFYKFKVITRSYRKSLPCGVSTQSYVGPFCTGGSVLCITDNKGANMGPPGSCRPEMGPMLAPWTLLSGLLHALARQSHYAFIFSRTKYGIEIYGSTSISNVNRLQVMQNKLLKLILKLDKFTSTHVLHRNMKILKIADVHVCNTLGVVNEMGSNRCSEIFKNYFKIKTNHYDLRTKNQMVIPPSRISLGDQTVRIKGASMWNKLDKDLLQYTFKTTLKQHLTQYYLKKY